ncbi:MAG: NFACT family protein [Lachnospiraceae bacterium]|nr:NFACT family protein [Lachnospiraceae bacterium]
MAFDGITVAGLCEELNRALTGMHIAKIAQPEPDELLITCKGNSTQKRLLLSANASLPLLYLTERNKPSPQTAPNFCMLLRKHIGSGRIVSVTQPSLERILIFTIEHLDELGDLRQKRLIAELMGKHSNIIFCDETDKILDSIKHISAQVSSVREVLPGRTYFIPETTQKENPLEADAALFLRRINGANASLSKAIYTSFTGISPVAANDLCFRAGVDADRPGEALSEEDAGRLSEAFLQLTDLIRNKQFNPVVYEKDGVPQEFSALPLACYQDCEVRPFETLSELLQYFYAAKAAHTRIRQKSADLRHIVTTVYERVVKKYDLQRTQLSDTEKRDKFRTCGELLTAFSHQIKEGDAVFVTEDYNTGAELKITLDPALSPTDNAQRYFAKYQKLKRTYEALTLQLQETETEKAHLESILMSLDLAETEADLAPIRAELIESGYLRKKSTDKKAKITSRPYHYRSSDGFDLYVGKNNYQNDELTFKLANSKDLWFHAKKMPGSHVILRTGGKEVPDRAYEEAAALAAYYSRGKQSEKVEVDYLQRKDVKKTPGTPPGYVIYYTNYSMTVTPGVSGLTLVEDQN